MDLKKKILVSEITGWFVSFSMTALFLITLFTSAPTFWPCLIPVIFSVLISISLRLKKIETCKSIFKLWKYFFILIFALIIFVLFFDSILILNHNGLIALLRTWFYIIITITVWGGITYLYRMGLKSLEKVKK